MKWTIYRYEVDRLAVGVRLDKYLSEACHELSRTILKKIIDLGGVHLNGRRVRNCSCPVKDGDRIEVYIDQLPLEPYRIIEQDVIFRDEYLIVLNKPAQIDTQPTHARYKGTLYEALLSLLQDPYRRHDKPTLGMIQRLDRGTSGLILFSIHSRAHKPLTRIFVEHQIEKRYLALVSVAPQPESGEICSRLARSRKDNRVKSVTHGGKEAITRYQTIETFSGAAQLDIELLTGRSHQIRAHMSERGCPLLGDHLYGGPVRWHNEAIQRPLLHAAKLALKHPVTGKQLEFTAPLPDDMVGLLAMMANNNN